MTAVKNDHNLMQLHLWAWEKCQLRAHRVTIERLLEERLEYTTRFAHMSLQDRKLAFMALPPHLSMKSLTSLRSEPRWLKYMDEVDMDDLDAHFVEPCRKPQRKARVLPARPPAVLRQHTDAQTLVYLGWNLGKVSAMSKARPCLHPLPPAFGPNGKGSLRQSLGLKRTQVVRFAVSTWH